MAFLCVLGVNATPSGTGTKEDPYVIADGDTYVVGKNVTTYASFTAPEEGMEQGTETPETTTLTFEGGTPKVEKTVVNLVKVEPEPNVVYPTEDQMLSFKDDRKVVTVEVDKKVKVKKCVYPMDMYGTLDWEKAEVSYTEEGHSIIKCTMSEAFYNFMGTIVTDVILQLDLTDEEGNEIEPKAEGFPESVVFGSGYNFAFGVNDGRFADASLSFKSVTPAENSYSTSLDKIEFTYGEKVYTTSTATAAVYKGEEKVADAILTTNEDETGLGLVVTAQFVEIGTQTPKEINEFGAYVLKVDSQSIANEYFNEETPWTDGWQGHGTCNPDFTVAFNIDPVIITVESVDPAPYVEGGEYSKEIPAEIKITLSNEGATVNSALVTYGMNTRVPAEAKVEGKVITVTVPEAALAENNIGVSVAAVNENGTPISYGTDGVILLAYQMPKNILVPTEVTPADGSTVKSIATVELTVDSKYGVGELNTNNVITVKKDGAEASNISAAIDYATGDDMNKMMITFTPEITEDGTYTVVIPEETFYDLDGNLFNPELTYTFIVDKSTNIGGVEVEDANAVVEVYSVDGCLVSKGKKADVMKKLVKGIYIINGQKVVIR